MKESSPCRRSKMQHTQGCSHHTKEDFCVITCVLSHLFVRAIYFLMTWVIFCNQIWSHVVELFGEPHAAAMDVLGCFQPPRVKQQPNGSTLFLVGKMSLVFPLSSLFFCVCFFFSSSSPVLRHSPHRLLHSLNHFEKGSVSHYLCVCISRNVCGTITDGFHRIKKFLWNSTGSNTNGLYFQKNPDIVSSGLTSVTHEKSSKFSWLSPDCKTQSR